MGGSAGHAGFRVAPGAPGRAPGRTPGRPTHLRVLQHLLHPPVAVGEAAPHPERRREENHGCPAGGPARKTPAPAPRRAAPRRPRASGSAARRELPGAPRMLPGSIAVPLSCACSGARAASWGWGEAGGVDSGAGGGGGAARCCASAARGGPPACPAEVAGPVAGPEAGPQAGISRAAPRPRVVFGSGRRAPRRGGSTEATPTEATPTGTGWSGWVGGWVAGFPFE